MSSRFGGPFVEEFVPGHLIGLCHVCFGLIRGQLYYLYTAFFKYSRFLCNRSLPIGPLYSFIFLHDLCHGILYVFGQAV
ncbi:MAG: hypothetical protein V3W19_07765, partial [Desulfatiglandales bacterium]